MVERRVQPLKQRVTLLYDYSRVEDPTRKTMEMLEVFEVMKQVEGRGVLGELSAQSGRPPRFVFLSLLKAVG
jgi:hypothetical protein